MKYTAVALLFAALTAPAVRAQYPTRKPPSSSHPESEWRTAEVPVKPQPGAPLRLSVKAGWLTDPSFHWVRATVENISDRDIGYYGFRMAAGGDGRAGSTTHGHSRLPRFSQPGKAFQPGQVHVGEFTEYNVRLFPLHNYEVHYVVFMDGTIWCADECHVAEYLAGDSAGGSAAVAALRKVLSDGGLDAVINALREKVAEDDPVPAVVVSTGELVDIKPPPGHTPDWERGFRDATKSVADTLWVQYVHQGTGNIERMLRDAYRVEAAK